MTRCAAAWERTALIPTRSFAGTADLDFFPSGLMVVISNNAARLTTNLHYVNRVFVVYSDASNSEVAGRLLKSFRDRDCPVWVNQLSSEQIRPCRDFCRAWQEDVLFVSGFHAVCGNLNAIDAVLSRKINGTLRTSEIEALEWIGCPVAQTAKVELGSRVL